MNLSDQYADEGRDGLAGQAYAQGLKRVRQLRATDPRILGDWNFRFNNPNLPPAERLLEALVQARYSRNYYEPSGEESALWQTVLHAPPGAPAGAVSSLPVYEFEVPVVDQVFVPALGLAGAQRAYNYLFQIDWNRLPPGMNAIRTALRTKEKTDSFKEVQLIQQRWVGAEATSTYARKGVPWIAEQSSGVQTVTGRRLLAGKIMSLPEALSVSMAQRVPATGILVVQTTPAPWPLAAATVQISAAFPPGQQPAGATVDAIWHVEAGLLAFLRGDTAVAAKEWRNARDMSLARAPVKREDQDVFWKRLLDACGGGHP
jgi:hypothetical protein